MPRAVAVAQCTNYQSWPVASYVHVVNRNLDCYRGSQSSWPDTVTVISPCQAISGAQHAAYSTPLTLGLN